MTLEALEGYDWDCAFKEAMLPSNPLTREVSDRRYTPADVVRIVAAEEGENDGRDWIGVFELNDGRFLTVRAGCDYTGWDCRAGGSSEWTNTEAEAIACLTPEERERLGPLLPTGSKEGK